MEIEIPKNIPKELFRYNNWIYVDKLNRVYLGTQGKLMPPYKLILIPTNRCNLKCPYCPNSFGRNQGRFREKDEVSNEEWLKLTEKALDMGAREFYILGGGEPMLKRDIVMEIAGKVKKANHENICELITNGTLFQEKDIIEIVNGRLFNKILVSIDGPGSDIHDSLRGVDGAFRLATSSLKRFRELKKKINSDKPEIQINYIINNRNYKYIPEMAELASKLGADKLALHPMREYEETREQMRHLIMDKSEERFMMKNIKKATGIAERNNLQLNTDMIEETRKRENTPKDDFIAGRGMVEEDIPELRTFCYEPFYSMLIDPKGNANYCCTAGDGIDSNNVVQLGIEGVWYGSFFSRIRENLKNGEAAEKCFNCGLYDMTHELRTDLNKFIECMKRQNGTKIL